MSLEVGNVEDGLVVKFERLQQSVIDHIPSADNPSRSSATIGQAALIYGEDLVHKTESRQNSGTGVATTGLDEALAPLCYARMSLMGQMEKQRAKSATTKLGTRRRVLELKSTVRAARLLQKDSEVKGVGLDTEISQLATISVRPGGGSGAGLREPNLVGLDTFIKVSDADMAAMNEDMCRHIVEKERSGEQQEKRHTGDETEDAVEFVTADWEPSTCLHLVMIAAFLFTACLLLLYMKKMEPIVILDNKA